MGRCRHRLEGGRAFPPLSSWLSPCAFAAVPTFHLSPQAVLRHLGLRSCVALAPLLGTGRPVHSRVNFAIIMNILFQRVGRPCLLQPPWRLLPSEFYSVSPTLTPPLSWDPWEIGVVFGLGLPPFRPCFCCYRITGLHRLMPYVLCYTLDLVRDLFYVFGLFCTPQGIFWAFYTLVGWIFPARVFAVCLPFFSA